ncbi:DUF421 domain-containing protein [Marinilactibacillus piezotolerans]|uniref:DUF421 domain-containing protein n=1 Tax=Marinilactibacillus piezotolerans TaxID=258723 RepID=UPI0009B151D2|nr:YetF domain-containing protein [Marinilactibacillus piezotolerans]
MSLRSVINMIIIGTLSYMLIIFVLRISGKRTLSKMNAFDFIVTVALGSTLSSLLINFQRNLWQGIIAFCLLVFLQFLTSWLSVRFKLANKLLKSQPTMLYYNGDYDERALKKERIAKNEITQALRSQGIGSTDTVSAVILETDGTFSVLKKKADSEETLRNVE